MLDKPISKLKLHKTSNKGWMEILMSSFKTSCVKTHKCLIEVHVLPKLHPKSMSKFKDFIGIPRPCVLKADQQSL